MNKIIELELTDPSTGDTQEYIFEVTHERYHKLVNTLSTSRDKVAPMHNFAVACVDKDQKPDFTKLLMAEVGLAEKVTGALMDEFLSDVEVTVKKPKPMPSTSEVAI